MPNAASEKRLAQVHPELARRIRLVIAELERGSIRVEVVQGLRSFDEQAALYAQGRTKTGKVVTNAKAGFSNHNFGLAVDLVPFLSDSLPNWEAPDSTWKAIGKAAEAQGLEWGGRWKGIVDRPHVQLPGLSVAQCRKHYQRGGLPAVWEAATRAIQAVETDAPIPRPTIPTQITSVASSPTVTIAQSLPMPTPRPSTWANLAARFLPFLSLGSAGLSNFYAIYKTYLWCAALVVLAFWLGWLMHAPRLERKAL
jgi:peptidoglycan L-alanyl-D-glutamate endopeptidase CwlK